MARLVFNAGDVFTIGGSNTVTEVFGTSGKDTITISAGAKATLFGFDSADAVSLGGNAGSYTAVRSGSSIVLTDAAGSSVTIPVSTTSQTITFADGARALVYNTASGNVELGSQAVTTTATTVTAGSGGGSSTAGQTFTLTAGVDIGSKFVGGAGNDVYEAYDAVSGANIVNTLGTADRIDGGSGIDTLELVSASGVTIAANTTTIANNIEILNVTSQGAVSVEPSAANFGALTAINVLAATTVVVTAADTTNVVVSGAIGATVAVDGGNDVTIASSKSGQAVTVGANEGSTGAVSISHAAQVAGAIAVDGGTNVSITAAGVTTGTVDVGATTEPSGSVVITSTGAAYDAAAAALTLGAIDVAGGTSVTVTQKAASSTTKAATDTTAADRTQSDITVAAAGETTSVTLVQDAKVTAVNAVAAVTKVDEVQTVTFGALAAGESVTIGGLTYTATAANTAAKVAAAFANLVTGATTGANGPALGLYTGSWTAEHTAGAAVNTGTTAAPVWKVTFTGSGAATDLTVTTSDGIAGAAADAANYATSVTTAGVDAVAAKTGVMGVVGGAFAITDAGNALGTDAVATVALTGFGAASSIASDALSTLSLSSATSNVTITNAVTKALALTVSGYGTSTATPTLAIGGTYTSLTVDTGALASSDFTLTGAGLTSLAVAGSKTLDLNASSLAALKTVTVTGSAGLTATGLTAATTTSFDTTGTTGTVSATIDATKATYAGGAGVDRVTTSGGASKAVSLGAGDDTLTFAASSATGLLSGGDGTDTLSMSSANAAAASVNGLFAAQISGFEKLSLAAVAAAATDTVDLANLDAINYVISAGTGAGSTLNIDNMAIGGTVELTGANAGTFDVDFVDATGTSDTLNVVTKVSTANVNFGTIDISGIEALSLTVSDSDTSTATGGGVNKATLAVTDAALKSVVISGNSAVDLSVGAAVTSIDGSGLTGALTVASNANATGSTTITAGAGNDVLTANGSGDVLVGGAGNDTLVAADNLVTLTGGAGSDTFDISTPTSNANTYATITDLSAGDKIKTDAAIANFVGTAVSLANTASFGDYVNAAVVAGGANGAAWFQFGGDTYLVHNVGAVAASFANGTDIIVKIAGSVNLSTAALNTDSNWLVIG